LPQNKVIANILYLYSTVCNFISTLQMAGCSNPQGLLKSYEPEEFNAEVISADFFAARFDVDGLTAVERRN
jgi:hypothetical protein